LIDRLVFSDVDVEKGAEGGSTKSTLTKLLKSSAAMSGLQIAVVATY
jgi:hypothetical protein